MALRRGRTGYKRTVCTEGQIQGAINSVLQLALEDISLDEILARTLELIAAAPWFDFEAKGAIHIVEDEPGFLVMRAKIGLAEEMENERARADDYLCGQADAEQKKAGLTGEGRDIQPGVIFSHCRYRIPIQSAGRLLGVISLRLNENYRQGQRDGVFLALIANTLAGIIERRRTEEALRRSEASLAKAQEIANIGYWRWDVKTRKMFWSDHVYRIYGLNKEETDLSYRLYKSRIHPEDRERVNRHEREAMYENKPLSVDLRIILPDGSERFIHNEAEIVRNDDGQPLLLNGSVQDITERKRGEERLLKLNRAFCSLGNDFEKNISLLTETCGDLLGADFVTYSRLDGGRRNTVAVYCNKDRPGIDNLKAFSEHPVYRHGQTPGLLSVCCGKNATLDENDKVILEIVTVAIGVEEERLQADRELHAALEDSEKRRAEVTALLESAGSVLKHKKLKIAVESIFSRCKKILGAGGGYVVLIDSGGESSHILLLDNGELSCGLGFHKQIPVRGFRGQAFFNRKAVYLNDFSKSGWADFLPPGHIPIDNVLYTPLEIGSEVVGLLALANKPGGFSENDLGMAAAFAEMLAIAIHNRRTTDSLTNSQERFRSVAQALSDAVITVDSHGKISFWNKAAETMFGYRVDEALNSSITIIMTGSILDLLADKLKETQKNHENLIGRTTEFTCHRKDNSEFPAEVSLSVWQVRKQKYCTLIIRDITGRKRSEQVIAAEKERLAVTLRSIGDGVFTTDVDGKVLLINRVAEDLTGMSNEMARGKPLNEVLVLNGEKDGRPVLGNPVDMALNISQLSGRYILNIPGKETAAYVSVTCSPLFNTESVVIGAVLVCRDVTERKKMEEEVLKAVKLESLGILAGGIAHDFNNMLMGVLLNIYIAKMNLSPGDESYKTLTEAENALMQAKGLTQQLLTFSKGGAPILKSATVGELLKDSALFALRGTNVRCEFLIPENLWPVQIDEGQISQVVNNLVINAIQAMPEGGVIVIHAQNARVPEKSVLPLDCGDYVKITVRDSGSGIPAEYINKIFDPYFTTKKKGSGLGLSTSYSIIKNHGGHITVESEEGRGASFYFFLPASKGSPPIKGEEEETPLSGSGKILIMDDEEEIRVSLGKILASFGYEVDFALDGSEAVELYKKSMEYGRTFDAVIMDLTIRGGMGGQEAIQKLLEIDPEVVAVVSSGYSSGQVMADFRKYGFKGVIIKPYRVGDLNKVLHSVISKGRAEKGKAASGGCANG